MKYDVTNFANRLKKIRKSRGMSQRELADKSILTNTMISRYELGQAIPTMYTICDLANALDVSIDVLFGMTYEGCDGCYYNSRIEWDMPCAACRRNKPDHYFNKEKSKCIE